MFRMSAKDAGRIRRYHQRRFQSVGVTVERSVMVCLRDGVLAACRDDIPDREQYRAAVCAWVAQRRKGKLKARRPVNPWAWSSISNLSTPSV